MGYEQFLKSKTHSQIKFGIDANFIPDKLFDYQKYIIERMAQSGRCAGFLDTGTGKTIIEQVMAINYINYTNKPVLILTPLGVAFQFITEAQKFGIDDISYCRDGKFTTKIVVTNYERLHYFNASDFDCLILDESSILKNPDGAIKADILRFILKIKYRFLFTATPSPNDYIELGTSSEALGNLGYTDMLSHFFKNNENTIDPMSIGVKWELKKHAVNSFFEWVKSWSISMRKPSDLGFSDGNFILPELVINNHEVYNKTNSIRNGQIQLFTAIAKTRSEIGHENRTTITERCQKAVELASNYDYSVYWCNLNPEGDLLQKLDKDSVQLKGSMPIDEKEEILMSFSKGEIKKLITKPKITCFGLNWQHCNHTVIFPTFSHEQFYQMVKRFHRFGQKRTVYADVVVSDGQKRVTDSLIVKAEKADNLYSKLNEKTNSDFNIKTKLFNQNLILPKW
jgi:superfamily II DNA or RNA helicase